MTILAKYAELLEQNQIGEMGVDIFVNQMIDDAEGVLIFEEPEGFQQHTDIDDYYKGVMNVVVRNKSTTQGNTLSDKIFKLIRGQGRTLGEYKILVARPEALPHGFGRNDGGYVEWLLTFELSFIVGENNE